MKRIVAFIFLLYLFIEQVTISSIKVIFWIYSKPKTLDSNFFKLPLDVSNSWQKIIIAHFITLTPGTLTVDIIGHELLIHILSSDEKASTVQLVKEKVEPLVQKLWGQK